MQCHGIESESGNQRDQRARLIGDREVGPVEGIAVVERHRTVRIFFANMIEDRFDARKTTHGLADEIAVMCSPAFCVRSEDSRVGKASVSTCRSRWWQAN